MRPRSEERVDSRTILPDDAPGRLCRLCRASKGRPFHSDSRDYLRCPVCELVFVPTHQFLSPTEEKCVYDTHDNRVDDLRYRRFLARLFEPMLQRLGPHSRGLDFGSGPGPTLSVMFEEAGHIVELYDPFYAPKLRLLQRNYDFIVASEVVEHLHQPGRELDRLWSCLKPEGWLGIMTKRVRDWRAFAGWHYKRDLTHICFFSIGTFRWLAELWGARLIVSGKDVVLFYKSQ